MPKFRVIVERKVAAELVVEAESEEDIRQEWSDCDGDIFHQLCNALDNSDYCETEINDITEEK